MTHNTIGSHGCGCGDYISENLVATASCRKSGSSPECSAGIAHLLTYRVLNDEGLKEIGALVESLFSYAGDCVVLVNDEDLEVTITDEPD